MKFAVWIPMALHHYDQTFEQVVANFELSKTHACAITLLDVGDMLVLAAPRNLHIRRDA